MLLSLTIKIKNFAFLFLKINDFKLNINKVLFIFLRVFNKLFKSVYALLTFPEKTFFITIINSRLKSIIYALKPLVTYC